jgi:hypothetical protein
MTPLRGTARVSAVQLGWVHIMWRQASSRVAPASLVLAVLLCGAAAVPARAETVAQAWRSPFGLPRAIALNPTDHSLWVAAGQSITHVSAGGEALSQTDGFGGSALLAVDSGSGSCWVARPGFGLTRLTAAGGVSWSTGLYASPLSLSVSPLDGSCWLVDSGAVVHVAADGAEMTRLTGYENPSAVSVDPSDGSCWLGVLGRWDEGEGQEVGAAIVHLGASGGEIWRTEGNYLPGAIGAVSLDGSCWFGDNDQIVRLAANGTEAARVPGTGYITSLSVDNSDGSCWAGSQYGGYGVTHVAADGTVLWQEGSYFGVDSLAADPGDGACWMVDVMHREFAHRAGDGIVLPSLHAFRSLNSLAVSSFDGSCWVQDGGQYWPGGGIRAARAHLASDGMELSWAEGHGPGSTIPGDAGGAYWVVERTDFPTVSWIIEHRAADNSLLWSSAWDQYGPIGPAAADPRDGSLWAVYDDGGVSQLVHLAAEGAELWHGGDLLSADSVSVSRVDGSVWVADSAAGQVIHLAAAGAQLWRSAALGTPVSVSTDSRDGSCWVAEAAGGQVIHLSATGDELWRGAGFPSLIAVSANGRDGTCWVSYAARIAHLAGDGTVLWLGGEGLTWAAASEFDGSCWAADEANAQLVRFAVTVPEPPVAAFSVDAATGPPPFPVQFTDESLGYPTSWHWSFGDGGTSTEQHPLHEYAAPGRYTISLTVTNAGGSDTDTNLEDIVQTWFEEDDPAIHFTGRWSTGSDPTYSGDGMVYSERNGARLTFTFSGTGIRWYTATGPDMGTALLRVDGDRAIRVNLHGDEFALTAIEHTGLPEGRHTVRVLVAGRRGPAGRTARVVLDALEVVP